MKKSILHRLIIISLVWVSSVAAAVGQDFYRVIAGSVHEYNINKSTVDAGYTWQLFTDLSFTSQADPTQAELIPLGAGRENEIRVNWHKQGDYYLLISVTTATGCSNRMAWHFIAGPTTNMPVARISGAPTLTLGSCEVQGQLLDASASGGSGLTFSWTPSLYLDNATSSKPLFLPGKTTRYHLTVTDSYGQKDTTSVLMQVLDAPVIITDHNVFVASPNAPILLDASKSKGNRLTYLWLSKEGIILNGGTTPTVQVSGLGMYYLKVTDSQGCTQKDSVNVGLYIQAINDTITTKVNESVLINVVRNDIPAKSVNPSSISIVTPPLHGIASFSADSLIIYMPEESYIGEDGFVYAICDYFKNCDQAKVLVLINDVPLFIPEAFSPNGDGVNDKFEIKGLFKYQTVQIDIFNRSGNRVYQSANYGAGIGKDGFWDGTIKQGLRIGSGPVPSGTYFYVLKLNGKQSINGSIYLDR